MSIWRVSNGDERVSGLEVSPEILDLDSEDFRRLGYWIVDRTIDHLSSLRERPAITTDTYEALHEVLGGPVPRERDDVLVGLSLLADVALENQQHGDHPRYFARVPGPSSHVAILGDWLASGMQGVGHCDGRGSCTRLAPRCPRPKSKLLGRPSFRWLTCKHDGADHRAS